MKSFTDYGQAIIAWCSEVKGMDGLPLCLWFDGGDQLYYVGAPGDHARALYTKGGTGSIWLLCMEDEQAAIWFQAFANANGVSLRLGGPVTLVQFEEFAREHRLRVTALDGEAQTPDMLEVLRRNREQFPA